jgi:hypothetical protein
MAKDHEIARHLITIIDAYTLWPRLLADTGLTKENLAAHASDESPTYAQVETPDKSGKVIFVTTKKLRATLEDDGVLGKICNALGLPYYDVYHLREVIPEDVEWCREMDRLGVKYHCTNELVKKAPADRSWINKVKLDLTAEQWCSLCMREGSMYVGGCCGNSSAQQDIMNDAFRDDGWIEARDLRRLADLGMSHDGDRSPYSDKSLVEHWGKTPMDPWTKLGCLYQLCEPNLKVDRTKEMPDRHTEPERLAEDALFDLVWEDHFRLFKPTPDKDDAAANAQHAALQLLHEAKYVYSLTTLHAYYTSLRREPFNGFAVRRVEGKEIAANGYGACIYASRAQAEDLLDTWARDGDLERYLPGSFEIVPCRITIEQGLEWIEVAS